METGTTALIAILAPIWFLFYWILGGVFFAVVALLRLGRVRKVRFSCLFSLSALLVAIGAAWYGIRLSEKGINQCLAKAETKTEIFTAMFGCGFAGVFGVFLVGAAVIILLGFLIMAISKSKSKPWIDIQG